MRRWLLLLFLITMGVDWPRLPFNAHLTDVAFAALAVAIVLEHKPWSRPRLTALDLAVIGYIAGSVAAVVFSPDQRASAIELVRQLYLVVVYVVMVMAVRQGFARTIATGLALSGAVLAATGLIAFVFYAASGVALPIFTPVMTLPYLGETVRVRALTSSEAMLACVLAMAVPFVALHPFVASSRLRAVAASVVLGMAALLTYSHSVAGLAVSTLVAFWHSLRPRLTLRIAAVALTVIVVVALNFAASFSIRSIGTSPIRDDTVFHYAVDRGHTQVAGVDVEYQTMSYLRIKQVAWQAFRSYPIFGVGLDRFHHMTEIAYSQGRLTLPYRAIDPHSTFFGRLAETGLVGVVTLIALWIVIAVTLDRLLARQPGNWIAIAATAGIVGTLVNTMNADVMNFRFLWAALGLVRALPDQANWTDRGGEV